MELQHKSIVAGDTKDTGDGVVEALVSVTGIVDNVNDIIVPGAYEKTLKARSPKGVWAHQWNEPVSKPLAVKELMPGDPNLPKTLANGEPWPAEAGALYVKAQFNLDTEKGRDAYSNVKFFADTCEWSVGYSVPQGGSKKDASTGIRHIKDINLFEYSPVLFGAASNARSIVTAVKSMFTDTDELRKAVKELETELEPEAVVEEAKTDDAVEPSVDNDKADEEDGEPIDMATEDEMYWDDEGVSDEELIESLAKSEVDPSSEDRSEGKLLPVSPVLVEKITILQKEIAAVLAEIYASQEVKAEAPADVEEKSIEDAMNALMASEFDAALIESIDDEVKAFNASTEAKDITKHATAAIDYIQEALAKGDAAVEPDLKSLAVAIGKELESSEAQTEPIAEDKVEEKTLTINSDDYADLLKIEW